MQIRKHNSAPNPPPAPLTLAEAIEALVRYGYHSMDCPKYQYDSSKGYPGRYTCKCGWREILKRAEAK